MKTIMTGIAVFASLVLVGRPPADKLEPPLYVPDLVSIMPGNLDATTFLADPSAAVVSQSPQEIIQQQEKVKPPAVKETPPAEPKKVLPPDEPAPVPMTAQATQVIFPNGLSIRGDGQVYQGSFALAAGGCHGGGGDYYYNSRRLGGRLRRH